MLKSLTQQRFPSFFVLKSAEVGLMDIIEDTIKGLFIR